MPITQIEEIAASVKHTLETITKLEVMQRFADYLSLASYSSNPHAAPDEDRLLREFGAILGPAGWKKIASVENLTKVLRATQISLRQHGSRQASIDISSPIDIYNSGPLAPNAELYSHVSQSDK